MRKDKLKGLMTFGALLGGIGLILIFLSDNFGTSIADGWLAAYDYANSSTYELKVAANTNKFLVTGSILFAIGLSTMVFTYYKMLDNEG